MSLSCECRVPGEGPGDASLIRALARDLGIYGEDFDPLDCAMGMPWRAANARRALAGISAEPWRLTGDTVERLELLAAALVSGASACAPDWAATKAVLDDVTEYVRPAVENCGGRGDGRASGRP